MDYLHIKVDDHDAPDLDVLITTIDYLDKHIEQGKPGLIHCNGGPRKDRSSSNWILNEKGKNLHGDSFEKSQTVT